MKFPKFLQEKGTIAFVAPSFGCAIEPYKSGFENAQKKWREQGYSLEFGPNCQASDGVGISSSPESCGRELTEYYCNKTSDCIISCGGGELMCEILDYVNFDEIKNAVPKWYMGYSDNTNMTLLLATLCDTAAIYGPCAAAFGMEPQHASLEDAMRLLRGQKLTMQGYDKWERESLKDEEHPYEPYNLTETSVIKYILPNGRTNIESLATENNLYEANVIEFSGRLLGGCMDCLVNLTGTKYDKVVEFTERYREDGIVWFLEACDMNLMSIRRAMWQMEHAGWFQYVKGFLIGRPLCNGQEMIGLDQYEAVLQTVRRHNVPVIMDADLGHLPPMMPLVTGSMAEIKMEKGKLEVAMEYK